MRKVIWLIGAVICAAVGLLSACRASDEVPGRAGAQRAANTASAATTGAAAATPYATPTGGVAEVRRITVAELQEAMKKNEAVVVDVRSEDAYDAGHIKGSISVPEGEIVNHPEKFPKDKLIVTYCA